MKGASTERQNHGGPQPAGGAISRQPVIGLLRGSRGHSCPESPAERAGNFNVGAEE